MRTQRLLDALLPRTRQAVLGTLLLHPERAWYVRELARHLGLQPSTVQEELGPLTRVGILKRRKEGAHVYYQADVECPILADLQGLLVKTAGLVEILHDILQPLGDHIEVAFVFGSMARGTELSTSDVDLLVIGSVGLSALAEPLEEAERRLAQPVNPSVWSPEEFRKNVATVRCWIDRNLARWTVWSGLFREEVESWIARRYPELARDAP